MLYNTGLRRQCAHTRLYIDEQGSAVESAIVALPLLLSFSSTVLLALWLNAIALVTQEAVFSSASAMAIENSTLKPPSELPSFQPNELFINHPTPALKSEAIQLASKSYGYDNEIKFHRHAANQVAGTAQRFGYSYGITSTFSTKKQIVAEFESNWYSVGLRMPGKINATVTARTLAPWLGASGSGYTLIPAERSNK